eukprot:IDg22615t1
MCGIVGAVDDIEIAIKAPEAWDVRNPKQYYNRKVFFALCVQVCVGADYKVQYISAKHAGETHDSTALQGTSL